MLQVVRGTQSPHTAMSAQQVAAIWLPAKRHLVEYAAECRFECVAQTETMVEMTMPLAMHAQMHLTRVHCVACRPWQRSLTTDAA